MYILALSGCRPPKLSIDLLIQHIWMHCRQFFKFVKIMPNQRFLRYVSCCVDRIFCSCETSWNVDTKSSILVAQIFPQKNVFIYLLNMLGRFDLKPFVYTTGCPIHNCIFSNAHCSYKYYPISNISSLLSWQWTDFYVGIIYGNVN